MRLAAGSDAPARPAIRAAPAILNAGALAGALDLAAASIQAWLRGRTPLRMLQGIAAGWLGRESFAHGVWSGALGLVTHFSIAATWAAIYWVASRNLPPMVRHPWWSGAAFALVVYTTMYEVVMPLSAIHRTPPRTSQDLLVGLLIHITCVGWPIALVTRAHTPRAELGAD